MASGWISKKARYAIYIRDKWQCCYCLKTCMPGSIDGYTLEQQHNYMRTWQADIATLDHIVPRHELKKVYHVIHLYKHELYNPRNLVTICNGCNASRKRESLYVWSVARGYNYYAIIQRIAERIMN